MSGPDYLVVDMGRVMEASRDGKTASAALARSAKVAEEQKKKLLREVKRATGKKKETARRELVRFEKRRLSQHERRRRALVSSIREAAERIAADVAAEHGQLPVFERSCLIVFDASREITDEVIRRLDEKK